MKLIKEDYLIINWMLTIYSSILRSLAYYFSENFFFTEVNINVSINIQFFRSVYCVFAHQIYVKWGEKKCLQCLQIVEGEEFECNYI